MTAARLVILCVLSTALLLGTMAGCSSRGSTPVAEPVAQPAPAPAGFSLISPAEALKVPSAVEDTARYCMGDHYDHMLPHLNVDNEDGHQVSAGNPYTNFQPAWDPAAPNAADLAYCIYRLGDLTGYTASRELRFGWMTPPDDWGDFWVGVGNFDDDRWDWFNGPQYPAVLTLGGLAHYISGSGEMLVTVLFMGDGCPTMDWVLIGDTVFDIDFECTPQNGLPPLGVAFTTDATDTVGAYPASYDFDFDGGGFDEVGNTTGMADFEYTVPGTYNAEVRVNFDNGEQESAYCEVIVVNPANTGPLAGLLPVMTMGNAPLTVEFDASNSYDTDGGSIIKYEWDFEMDGVYDRDTGTDPTTSYTFAKAGVSNVVVRVTDNDLATDTDAVLVSIGTGWHVDTLDTTARLTDNPSLSRSGMLLMTGPLPTVAYRAYGFGAENAVRFIRAADVQGHAWGAPIDVVIGSDKGFGVSLYYWASGLINLYPCIAYGVGSGIDMDLTFISASAMDGTLWNSPQELSIDERCGGSNFCGMANRHPMVLTNRGGDLYSIRATSGDGSTWGSFVTVQEVTSVMGHLSKPTYLWTTDGVTAASHAGYRLTDGEPAVAQILLRPAIDDDCTGWGAPVVAVDNLDYYTAYEGCSFAVVDGQLAVAYNEGYPAQLYYCRATNATATEWGTPVLIDGAGNRGHNVSLAWWPLESKPVVCYYDWDGKNLLAATGTDSTGMAWDTPMVIDSSGDIGRFLDMQVYNDTPVVVYSDNTNNDLKFAAWY